MVAAMCLTSARPRNPGLRSDAGQDRLSAALRASVQDASPRGSPGREGAHGTGWWWQPVEGRRGARSKGRKRLLNVHRMARPSCDRARGWASMGAAVRRRTAYRSSCSEINGWPPMGRRRRPGGARPAPGRADRAGAAVAVALAIRTPGNEDRCARVAGRRIASGEEPVAVRHVSLRAQPPLLYASITPVRPAVPGVRNRTLGRRFGGTAQQAQSISTPRHARGAPGRSPGV